MKHMFWIGKRTSKHDVVWHKSNRNQTSQILVQANARKKDFPTLLNVVRVREDNE